MQTNNINNYLATKIEKVQRLGSVKCTTHECQNLTTNVFIKNILNINTYKMIYHNILIKLYIQNGRRTYEAC